MTFPPIKCFHLFYFSLRFSFLLLPCVLQSIFTSTFVSTCWQANFNVSSIFLVCLAICDQFQATFRFPGEAQQIDRLLEKFARHYVECNSDFDCKRKNNCKRVITSDSLDGASAGDSISSSLSTHQSSSTSDLSYSATSTSSSSTSSSTSLPLPEHFTSLSSSSPPNGSQVEDEVFVLSFAIVMLNTDLHTPNNKTRMTCDQWIKNLRVWIVNVYFIFISSSSSSSLCVLSHFCLYLFIFPLLFNSFFFPSLLFASTCAAAAASSKLFSFLVSHIFSRYFCYLINFLSGCLFCLHRCITTGNV